MKSCNLYRFTDLDVYEQPKVNLKAIKADNLFLKFDSKSVAMEKIRELKSIRLNKQKQSLEKKRKGPFLHDISEDSALIPSFISADSALKTSRLVQI